MTDKRSKKIAIAMSGGVDSSIAAAMLIEQGHDIFGMTMRLTPADNCDYFCIAVCFLF